MIEISAKYKQRVNDLLEEMPRGQKVRVAKITKKETRQKFIQAVKNWIDEQEFDGDGVVFSSDYKIIYKRKEDPRDYFLRGAQMVGKTDAQTKHFEKKRDALIAWFEKRLQGPKILPFCHNSAELTVDPDKAIEGGLLCLKNSKIGSHPFNAWFNRMETFKELIADRDKREKKKTPNRKQGEVYYYKFVQGPFVGNYYSHVDPPEIHQTKMGVNRIIEITIEEAKEISKFNQLNKSK